MTSRPTLARDIQPPSPTDEPEAKVARYYSDLRLSALFEDLDRSDVYERAEAAIRDARTLNFVVDFGGAKEQPEGGRARWALNVGVAGIGELLSKPRPRELRTRWINIFSPDRQNPLVDAVTAYYGFSPRLTNVITTPPSEPAKSAAAATLAERRSKRQRVRNVFRLQANDVEQGDTAPDEQFQNGVPLAPLADAQKSSEKMNYMNLVRNVWHWHAVEYGGRYVCIGMNNLHNVETPTLSYESPCSDVEDDFDDADYDPEGKRLWCWLVLCDDGTVVSIHEGVDDVTEADLITIRRNMLTVFRSLSQSEAAIQADKKDAGFALGGGFDDLPFRRHLANQDGENVEGGPSLLLYYLFDEWHSSYSFVLGRGYPYSLYMRQLRKAMSKHPELDHLTELNKLARQLDTLKRMYETKRIIVDNILCRHENSLSYRKYGSPQPATPRIKDTFVPTSGNPDILGVPLNALSVAKFERLRDRIKLYALGELESLLSEKGELENAAFNLISLKENETVEKLTRITIWLTKVTFLFMPLTLVTGYFSMQLKDINGVYDLRAFWGSVGVAVAVSLIVLYTVGKSTGTSEMRATWDGFVEVWVFWKRKGKSGGKRVRKGLEKRRSQQI